MKRSKIISCLIILTLFFIIFNSADFTNGVFIEGGATSLFITGFGGLSLPFSTGSFLINPSLSAPLFQDEGAFLFGGFTNFLYLSSYFNFITDIGNLSIFGSYIGNYSSINYAIIKTSFSKMINESFYAGFGLNIFTNNFSSFGFGLDFGITVVNGGDIPIGFSFSRFSYAFVIKNLGLPIKIDLAGAPDVSVPPIGIGAGVSFTFLNISNIIYSKAYSDLYLYFYPLGFGLKTGLIFNILDYVDIVAAFNLGTQQTSLMESAWFFLGISFKIPVKNNTIYGSYTFIPTSTGIQHSITTSFAFGKVDTQAPKAEITIQSSSPRNAFSPNYDGQKDEINIKTNFKDNGIIAGWKVEIFNQDKQKVKEFIGQDVRKVSYLTLQKIFSRLFENKKAVEIPEIIIWDGTNLEGQIAPDGIYKVIATVWDERYNTTESEPKYITIDTKIDPFNIKLKDLVFSPNEDGNLDKLEIQSLFENFEENGQCELKIIDSKDNIINTYDFDSKNINDNQLFFNWDGKTNSGKIADEGNYSILLKYWDDAGNSLEKKSEKIRLVIGYEILNLKLLNQTAYFSSNKSSKQNQVDFSIEISSKEGIQSLTYNITDSNGNIIYSKTFNENIATNFNWNGIKNDNNLADDGEYRVFATASYISGNKPKSNEIKIYKDSVNPQASIKEEYIAFSPNEDGVQDTIKFEFEIEKNSKIVEIQIVSSDGQKITFPVESIQNGQFIWDGNDSNGNNLNQGSYFVEFKVEDLAGNISDVQSKAITLVRKAEEVSINSDIAYYSPNNDKRNDIINFTCFAENSENVIQMDLLIEDSEKKIILTKSFQKFIPNIQFLEPLPEGKIFYYIKVFYNNGNAPTSVKRVLFVDLTAPGIKLSTENPYFTTRNPFANDVIVNYEISEKISNTLYSIIDNNNKKILEQNLLEQVGEIKWSGKSEEKSFNEGEYKMVLTCFDLAGNKSENSISIYLITNTPKIKLESELKTISPNNDSFMDQSQIKIISDDTKTLDRIIGKTIYIKNSENQIVETVKIELDSNSYLFTGNKLDDGTYNISLVCDYQSGIKESSEINVSVDRTPPKIDLVIKPELFSPDNDGEKDNLFITYAINDFSEIDSYTIRIYRLFEGGKKSLKPFKVFQFSKPIGNTITNQIKWDGSGDEAGSIVDSAVDYELSITAKDFAGNEITVNKNFTVDILVMKTDLGYKIIINSIEFDFNSAKLKKSNYKILDLLIKKLLKFPDYKILIVGFTDSTGDPEYNLKLSEKRAKAVYDYLVKNDIPKSRLEYKGMGSQNPIDSNENDDGRRRNRRVEFYLIKMNQ